MFVEHISLMNSRILKWLSFYASLYMNSQMSRHSWKIYVSIHYDVFPSLKMSSRRLWWFSPWGKRSLKWLTSWNQATRFLSHRNLLCAIFWICYQNHRTYMRDRGKKKEGQRNVLPPQIFNGDDYIGVREKLPQKYFWNIGST